MRSSAVQCVKAAQRIENPVRPRNGTATVSVEAPHKTKVGHWEDFLRRLCEGLGYASQETCLNVCSTSSSLYGIGGSVFVQEFRLQQSIVDCCSFFCFSLEEMNLDVDAVKAKASPDENL